MAHLQEVGRSRAKGIPGAERRREAEEPSEAPLVRVLGLSLRRA
jgi:hypothetical protein